MADRIVSTPAQAALEEKSAASEESFPGLSLGPFLRFKSGTPSFPAISVATGRAARPQPKRVGFFPLPLPRDCSSAVTSASH